MLIQHFASNRQKINLQILKIIGILCFMLGSISISSHCHAQSSPLPIQSQYVKSTKPFILYVSGDGGMNSFSTRIIKALNQDGYATVALDAKKYFWSAKTPNQFAKEISPVIEDYLKLWHKDRFYLMGYSFGADVSAFLTNYLDAPTATKMNSMVLISPGYSTDYEVKLMDMMRNSGKTTGEKYQVYPELLKANKNVLCIFGADENSDFYAGLKETNHINKVLVKGAHHYEGDINTLIDAIKKGF